MAYGAPVLRQRSRPVSPDYPNLPALIADMWDTLHHAGGAGLAAPQVNHPIRVFIVESTRDQADPPGASQTLRDYPGIRQVFINPQIIAYSPDTITDREGCLSIPGLEASVPRSRSVTVEYWDTGLMPCRETFHGRTARIIAHEYDHLEGKLYLDYLGVLQRRLWQGKLASISRGKVRAAYPMRYR